MVFTSAALTLALAGGVLAHDIAGVHRAHDAFVKRKDGFIKRRASELNKRMGDALYLVLPTETSTASASSASSTSVSKGVAFSGTALWAAEADAANTCGETYTDEDLVVALDESIYKSSLCGESVFITDLANGNNVTALVSGSSLSNYTILSKAAFYQLESELSVGEIAISYALGSFPSNTSSFIASNSTSSATSATVAIKTFIASTTSDGSAYSASLASITSAARASASSVSAAIESSSSKAQAEADASSSSKAAAEASSSSADAASSSAAASSSRAAAAAASSSRAAADEAASSSSSAAAAASSRAAAADAASSSAAASAAASSSRAAAWAASSRADASSSSRAAASSKSHSAAVAKATANKNAAVSSSSKSSSSSGMKSGGEITYYYQTGEVNCEAYNGGKVSDSDMICAVSEYDYYSNSLCGEQIEICYSGNCIDVTIVDSCQGCDASHFDLSPAAFKALAGSLDAGDISSGVTYKLP